MDAFLNREVNTTQDLVDFYITAGYDYVPVRYRNWFSGVKNADEETFEKREIRKRRKERRTFTNQYDKQSIIKNLEDFKRYDWSQHGWLKGGGNLSYFDHIAGLIPPKTKLIAWSDGVYEFFTKFIGYETFCYSLYDQPEFVETVLREVGERAVEAYGRVAAHPAVGALWLADDVGYTEGLLWSPELMRKLLFPVYRKIGDIARRCNKPLIFHSDGKLWDIVPDLIEAGFNALQPIEPKAWNAVEVKRKFGDKLCVMGTIDLDQLCRGSREKAISMVKEHLDLLAPKGGFVVGTSNTPAYYINQDNFRAMLETALEYRL